MIENKKEAIKTFNDLQIKLNLTQTEEDNFFPEWYEELPEITEGEQVALARLKPTFSRLAKG